MTTDEALQIWNEEQENNHRKRTVASVARVTLQ